MSKYIIKIEKGTDYNGEMEEWTPFSEGIESDRYVLISCKGDKVTTDYHRMSVNQAKDILMVDDSASLLIRAAAVMAEAETKAEKLWKAAENASIAERMRRILAADD